MDTYFHVVDGPNLKRAIEAAKDLNVLRYCGLPQDRGWDSFHQSVKYLDALPRVHVSDYPYSEEINVKQEREERHNLLEIDEPIALLSKIVNLNNHPLVTDQLVNLLTETLQSYDPREWTEFIIPLDRLTNFLNDHKGKHVIPVCWPSV
jgi:hypothetical protein